MSSFAHNISSDSSDTGEPFSGSSSISPPFLSTIQKPESRSTPEVLKLCHNFNEEAISNFSSPKSAKPASISPKINYSSLSGITTISHGNSFAKSTPSISTDFLKEKNQHFPPTTTGDALSFRLLQTSFDFEKQSIKTYHEASCSLLDPTKETSSRYKSLANIPIGSTSEWTASPISSYNNVPSKFSSLLTGNKSSIFGDPLAIKPIVSAYEFPPYKKTVYSLSIDEKRDAPSRYFERHSSSYDEESSTRLLSSLQSSEKCVKQLRKNIEFKQQPKQAEFLSLSLSPPMNRRNRNVNMPALKGWSVCL